MCFKSAPKGYPKRLAHSRIFLQRTLAVQSNLFLLMKNHTQKGHVIFPIFYSKMVPPVPLALCFPDALQVTPQCLVAVLIIAPITLWFDYCFILYPYQTILYLAAGTFLFFTFVHIVTGVSSVSQMCVDKKTSGKMYNFAFFSNGSRLVVLNLEILISRPYLRNSDWISLEWTLQV